jgi:hypothetical protein
VSREDAEEVASFPFSVFRKEKESRVEEEG